jgi:hypothetical protein
MRTEATLADVLHDGLCADQADPEKCSRYAKGYGHPHHDYYQSRAIVLTRELEPLIGGANVLPVARIFLYELV